VSAVAGQVAVWAVALILVAVGGFWAALWLRKRMLDEGESLTEGLTLGALRDMHARGELSDEEYEAARAAVLAQAGVDPSRAGGFVRDAAPGVDLTGAPLPGPGGQKDAKDSGEGANEDREPRG